MNIIHNIPLYEYNDYIEYLAKGSAWYFKCLPVMLAMYQPFLEPPQSLKEERKIHIRPKQELDREVIKCVQYT